MQRIINIWGFLYAISSVSSFALHDELITVSKRLEHLAQKLSEKNQPDIGSEFLVPFTILDTYKINNTTIHLIQGDITKLKSKKGIQVYAIVNAANKQLARGSGVCGALFNAAEIEGEDFLTREIRNLYAGGIQPGQAVITESYGLASEEIKKIIHALGPIYKNYQDKKEAADVLKAHILKV